MLSLGLGLAALTPALAQNATVSAPDLFSGKGPAPTLKLRELNATWRRVTINGPAELKGSGSASSFAGGIFGAMFGGGMPPAPSYSPPSYTLGATTTLGGETFLVVYRPNFKALDLGTLMKLGPAGQGGGELPAPEKLTADSSVVLTLVNVRSITSLADFRAFNLQQELAESAKAAEEEAKFIQQLQQGPGGGLPPGLGGGAIDATPVVTPDAPPAKPKGTLRKPAPKK
jgi:hypothetical protein